MQQLGTTLRGAQLCEIGLVSSVLLTIPWNARCLGVILTVLRVAIIVFQRVSFVRFAIPCAAALSCLIGLGSGLSTSYTLAASLVIAEFAIRSIRVRGRGDVSILLLLALAVSTKNPNGTFYVGSSLGYWFLPGYLVIAFQLPGSNAPVRALIHTWIIGAACISCVAGIFALWSGLITRLVVSLIVIACVEIMTWAYQYIVKHRQWRQYRQPIHVTAMGWTAVGGFWLIGMFSIGNKSEATEWVLMLLLSLLIHSQHLRDAFPESKTGFPFGWFTLRKSDI